MGEAVPVQEQGYMRNLSTFPSLNFSLNLKLFFKKKVLQREKEISYNGLEIPVGLDFSIVKLEA